MAKARKRKPKAAVLSVSHWQDEDGGFVPDALVCPYEVQLTIATARANGWHVLGAADPSGARVAFATVQAATAAALAASELRGTPPVWYSVRAAFTKKSFAQAALCLVPAALVAFIRLDKPPSTADELTPVVVCLGDDVSKDVANRVVYAVATMLVTGVPQGNAVVYTPENCQC